MDANDALSQYRAAFHLPKGSARKQAIYFLGNSLGLQPKTTEEYIEVILNDWQTWGV